MIAIVRDLNPDRFGRFDEHRPFGRLNLSAHQW